MTATTRDQDLLWMVTQVGVQAGPRRRRTARRPYSRESQEPNSCHRWRVGDDVVVQERTVILVRQQEGRFQLR